MLKNLWTHINEKLFEANSWIEITTDFRSVSPFRSADVFGVIWSAPNILACSSHYPLELRIKSISTAYYFRRWWGFFFFFYAQWVEQIDWMNGMGTVERMCVIVTHKYRVTPRFFLSLSLFFFKCIHFISPFIHISECYRLAMPSHCFWNVFQCVRWREEDRHMD